MESLTPPISLRLSDLQDQGRDIRRRYDQSNASHGREPWDAFAFMLGFVADVGDLSKLVMGQKGLRDVDDLEARLAHELADCLWSIFILADECNIDLEQAFLSTMSDLESRFDQKP